MYDSFCLYLYYVISLSVFFWNLNAIHFLLLILLVSRFLNLLIRLLILCLLLEHPSEPALLCILIWSLFYNVYFLIILIHYILFCLNIYIFYLVCLFFCIFYLVCLFFYIFFLICPIFLFNA